MIYYKGISQIMEKASCTNMFIKALGISSVRAKELWFWVFCGGSWE